MRILRQNERILGLGPVYLDKCMTIFGGKFDYMLAFKSRL